MIALFTIQNKKTQLRDSTQKILKVQRWTLTFTHKILTCQIRVLFKISAKEKKIELSANKACLTSRVEDLNVRLITLDAGIRYRNTMNQPINVFHVVPSASSQGIPSITLCSWFFTLKGSKHTHSMHASSRIK